MKLMTEITARKAGGSVLGFSKEVDLMHDAAAAHALRRAIQNRMDRAMDGQDERDKVKLAGVLHYADELMVEWGFGPSDQNVTK